ncbi:hypothetical protein [Spirillospora sp. NPDC048823]|uniref:beta family protein n=1 Tax=unclassified Spirillospora TaxID=2642701 RepID=UPI003720ECA8
MTSPQHPGGRRAGGLTRPTGGEATAEYVPVLQARQGELLALGKLDRSEMPQVHPVLEAVCYKDNMPLRQTTMRLAELVTAELLKGTVPAVDCVHLDRRYGLSGDTPLQSVSEDLALMMIPMRPVVRVASGGLIERVLLAAAEAADVHGEGALVRVVATSRLSSQTEVHRRSREEELVDRVATVVERLGGRAEQLDLLVDFGAIGGRLEVEGAVHSLHQTLAALAGWPWRRIAVAAAAFPDRITSVPLGQCVAFPRLDADLWRQSVTGAPELSGRLGFGDYGVAGTSLPRDGFPKPNLRYTAHTCWHTYRYPSAPNGGFSTFYDLCRDVTEALWWSGEDYSWGDGQIALRARRVGGPGGAAQWRAFALSHHVSMVLAELAGEAR